MKKSIVFLFALSVVVSCRQNETRPTGDGSGEIVPADGKYPAMTFTETEYDFGDIASGAKVTHEFRFKNTGEANLIISNAYGSCGCTVPEYPKESIPPGESGEITVTFNSAGKHGRQHKTVTLVTNSAKHKEQLQITANINGD